MLNWLTLVINLLANIITLLYILYIAINFILIFKFSGRENNFQKANPSLVTDFGIAYDYQSIMHYRRQEDHFLCLFRGYTMSYETSN